MQGLVIAGTHSGCGKTTVTLGILAALYKKGLKVQPFKTGPDFIDTGLHKLVSGRISRNLDLWMCGSDYVLDSFQKHSAGSDIAVVEGVMGMYDGNVSTAHLAVALGLPVILVVDAYGMAESAGAVVKGFKEYRGKAGKGESGKVKDNCQTNLAGVIFNNVASERHYQRLKESVRETPVLGYLPRDLEFKIPQRHLGLVVAEEHPITADEIDKLADAVLMNIDVDHLIQDSIFNIQDSRFGTQNSEHRTNKSKLRIAVAYDKAFCFYYEDNLDLLREAGAEIATFSPLTDSILPDDADALYIGGGYPELNAKQLSANKSMLRSVHDFADRGKVVYAECGGFMYLTEGIYDLEEVFNPMASVFPFKTRMTKSRAGLGYREAVLEEDSILGQKGSSVRGHEFHYSEIVSGKAGKPESGKGVTSALSKIYSVTDGSDNERYKEGYRVKNVLGSYIHIHFGSNPETAGHILKHIKEHHGTDTVSRARQSEKGRQQS